MEEKAMIDMRKYVQNNKNLKVAFIFNIYILRNMLVGFQFEWREPFIKYFPRISARSDGLQ